MKTTFKKNYSTIKKNNNLLPTLTQPHEIFNVILLIFVTFINIFHLRYDNRLLY